jgi:hypothetical protein
MSVGLVSWDVKVCHQTLKNVTFLFFHSDAFCSFVDTTSVDLTGQTGGASSLHRHLSSDVSPKQDKCSSVFLNVGGDGEPESYSCIQQIPRYNADKSDSFIVFEASCAQESKPTVDDCEQKVMESNSAAGRDVLCCSNSENSSKCLSAWGEESRRKRTSSTTECHDAKKKIGHRRPLSLDFSRGGGVVMPSPKVCRMYLFIQMQLCRRESLREWLRDNMSGRSTCVVLPMFEQIVQAVEYVHLQGLIHRDLKVRIVSYWFINYGGYK